MSTAATASEQKTKIVIGPVRLSYASIWEPKAVNEGDEKKYSTSCIIPKGDEKMKEKIDAAIEAAKELGKSKWGGKIPAKLKLPLRDGDEERPDDEAYNNAWFLNATSKTKPGIVDLAKKEITDPALVYSGCYVYISINFYPFDTKGNKGIAVGLNNIMKSKDGEALAGRASAEADFAEIEVEADDDLL